MNTVERVKIFIRGRMKKQKFFFIYMILFFFIFAYSNHGLFSADKQKKDKIDLEIILEKCAEYCERISNAVLFFVCKETIKEEIYRTAPRGIRTVTSQGNIRMRVSGSGPNIEINTYVYDYQLIRKNNITKENRTLLEENGRKMNKKNAPLQTKIFEHKNVIMGPIGLLSEYWQKFHEYKIVKEAKFKGEKVIIIETVPKYGFKLNQLSGKIWVKKNDFSILKTEWNQQSIENYDKIEELAKELNAKPLITLVSEYAFEKKGIRFPSKYSIKEVYILQRGRRFLRSRKTVIYSDYQFFTVETDIKY
jgi:hypothetical protein